MGIADDVIQRADKLAADRQPWLKVWFDIARFVIPTESAAQAFANLGGSTLPSGGTYTGQSGPNSAQRIASIYDNTGMMAVDRLTAGVESLVTPQSDKWHNLTLADVGNNASLTDDENAYFERLRNFQFAARYDPRAGFISSHQKALRSCVAFGTGVMYNEEGDGRARPGDAYSIFRYRYVPLAEAHMATNDNGNVDTNYRCMKFTVKQLVQKFGRDRVSAAVRNMYETGDLERQIDVIHAVCPRLEMGSSLLAGTIKGSPVASYYVERETRHLISDSGYFEFPFSVYHWLQQDNGPYAESPVMLALSEIKGLQAMGKAELRAFAQWTDPPLGMPSDGVMNRPNLNPRAVNMGAVGPDGSLRVKPLITSQNPDFAEKVMETRRAVVRDTLYINLFQTLIKNPEMTATEAMIRANEKGELLGPAGGKIQAALAAQIDRELGILERKGIFRPGQAFEPPPSLAQRSGGFSIGVKFASPLDRLRRANEGIGIMRMLDAITPLAKVKQTVLDLIDEDQVVREVREIFGAPASVIASEQLLASRRQQTQQKTSTAESLMAGQAAADIAKAGSIAGRNIGETATQAPQIADAVRQILDQLQTGMQGSPNAPQASVDTANALLSQFGRDTVRPEGIGLPTGG